MDLLERVRQETHAIKSAPFSFVTFLIVGATIGYVTSSWYYSRLITDQGGQISRYRVALGIDKAPPQALIELNNEELRAKAENTAGVIRELCFEFQRRNQQIEKQMKDQKIATGSPEAMSLWTPMGTEMAERFDRDVKPDFTNVDAELRRRLGPQGMDGMVVLAPELPFNITSLMSGPFESLYMCKYADELEEMAKRLPADSQKP